MFYDVGTGRGVPTQEAMNTQPTLRGWLALTKVHALTNVPAPRNWMERLRRLSIGSLYLGSVLYQVSQLSIAIVLPQIRDSLGATPAQQGLILAGFPLGVGVFALLSGVWIRRWGPTWTVIVGLFTLGVGETASAFAFSAATLVAARMLAGAGVGIYFPATVALLAANTPEARRTTAVGLLVSLGLAVGGSLEFLGGALVGARFGWQVVLGSTGLLSLGGAALTYVALRRAPLILTPYRSSLDRALIGTTLRMGSVWGLAIALLGALNAGFTAAAFLAAYVTSQHASWGILYAGLVGAMALALTLPGGFLGGWVSERGVDRRVVLAGLGIPSAVLVLLVPSSNPYSLAGIFAAEGLLLGAVLAVLFSMPSHIPEMSGLRVPVVVGVIDGTRILFSATFAFAFGVVVGLWGYSLAWTVTALVALGCIPFLVVVPPNRSPPRPHRPVSMS